MTRLLFLLIFMMILGGSSAQKATSRSRSGSLAPARQESKNTQTSSEPSGSVGESKRAGEVTTSTAGNLEYRTPFLIAEVSFTDPSDNNLLDAGEEWLVHVKLTNTGRMPAERCEVNLKQETIYPGITIVQVPPVDLIAAGESHSLDIRIRAGQEVRTAKVPLKLSVLEKRGFDLEPELRLTIPTQEFQPPILEFVDYVIQDQNRNSKIEKREIVDVIFRIQNKGKTTAYACRAKVILGENVLPIDVQDEYDLGDIRPGEFKDLMASVVTNARTTEVNMTVAVTERSAKSGTRKTFNMPFDIVQKKPDEMTIPVKEPQPVNIPAVASMKLDIAENIPSATKPNPNGIAIIIGNKDYEHAPEVDFALNDARLVRNYAVKALGYKEMNVIVRENAKQSELFTLFGNESNFRGQLYNYAVKGQSEIFIYYSGHGAPDPNTGQGYLVPVDCDPNSVALNGYPIQLLLTNLQKVIEEKQLAQVTVVFEACFSGVSESGSLLRNVSPVSIRLKDQQVTSDKLTVFTSASGDQLSNWYPEMRQSLFTYFFLKGLKGDADINRNRIITANELHQYVADEVNGVPYWAKRLHNGRNQTPTVRGNLDVVVYK